MSSTDDRSDSSMSQRRLREFYRQRLIPAADALRRRGVTFFPLEADDQQSWYLPRPSEPELMDITPEAFSDELEKIWRAKGMSELADLSKELGALARELEILGEENNDVSPFIYVMF